MDGGNTKKIVDKSYANLIAHYDDPLMLRSDSIVVIFVRQNIAHNIGEKNEQEQVQNLRINKNELKILFHVMFVDQMKKC